MRHSAHVRSLLTLAVPLSALALLIGGKPRAFADDPEPPPAMGGDSEPGMDGDAPGGMDGGAAPGMDGGGPAKPDPDAEDGVDEKLSERVKKAIEKGTAWLMKRQAGGNWGPLDIAKMSAYGGGKGNLYPHAAGLTGLALYTLLSCQIPPTQNIIKGGFDWLDKHYRRPQGTYETAVLLMAVCATADPAKKTEVAEANRAQIKERLTGPMRKWAQDLVESLARKHEGRKGWRYQVAEGTSKATEPGHNGDEDMSSTQLAALALLKADRCGVSVPTALWKDVLAFSLSQQEDSGPEVERTAHLPESKSGKKDPKAPPPPPAEKFMDHARGFSYMKKSPDPKESGVYNSMTACGLAGLMLPRFVLENRQKDASWKKGGLDVKVQQAVFDALAWLDLNWSPFENTQHDDWHDTYYLYCVERAMDLVGNKLIGKHIWYVEGAEQLVNRQKDSGCWDTGKTYPPCDIVDTCFALLFLRRSTKGVIAFPDVTGGSDEPPVDRRGKGGGDDGG